MELALLKRNADFYGHFKPKTVFKDSSGRHEQDRLSRGLLLLDLQPVAGEAERLYLDSQTFLPVRNNMSTMVGTVLVPVEVYLRWWQAVMESSIRFMSVKECLQMTMVLKVDEIKHNVQIDPKVFEP